MNRRQFLSGAIIAPVGAIAAAKVLPAGYVESAETKLKRWFEPMPRIRAKPAPEIWSTKFHADMRSKHQHELNVWLRERVDQAAFDMMKGDLDGKG